MIKLKFNYARTRFVIVPNAYLHVTNI